jgi:hypothetical protein
MSQADSSQPPQIKSRIGAILRATSGNFLEQFDFFLFGFYATYIARAFFPSENETAALLNTFGVFWLGALMRPVGAIVLGAYIDRIGRRLGLIVTLAIMAAGTVIITICPTYATIGVAAPVIVLIAACCRASPPASNSAACRSISPRSRRPATGVSTPRSSPRASRLRSSSPQSSDMSSMNRCRRRPSRHGDGAFPSSSAASSFPLFSCCGGRWRKRRRFWP